MVGDWKVKQMSNWLRDDPNLRSDIYRVAKAVVALAVIYGLLTANLAQAWLVLIFAVLELADRNVH